MAERKCNETCPFFLKQAGAEPQTIYEGYPNGIPREVTYEGHCELKKEYHEWAFEVERDAKCCVCLFMGREEEITKWLSSTAEG